MKLFLTITPPGPVTNQVELEVRWALEHDDRETVNTVLMLDASPLDKPETLALIQDNAMKKGDVLTVAQVAGIQAAKRTHELIPMCHPLLLSDVSLDLTPVQSGDRAWVDVEATVRTTGKTGVEMEAPTAVSGAAPTVYDMCKAVDRAMPIGDVRLVHKHGGKSGEWNREEE